jgi:uncharacterized protein with von Willebrand factor type A (vWA) domain
VFLDLFFGLRAEGVPVGIQEWLALAEVLGKGLHGSSLLRFYRLARACLVKSEAYYDAYDRVFARVFHGVEGSLDIEDEVLEWLRDPKNFPALTPEQLAELERMTGNELMRRFLDTLAQQDGRHDGGSRWVGTGGRSPFGHGGQHPTGIRVGGKPGRRSAMKVAEERRFRDYRTDVALDVRQMRSALKRLRQLTRSGLATELDLEETIDETCRNAGEIELVFQPPRRNNLRLLLMMDVGGTMEPYFEPVSALLTALHEEHGLRELRTVYFHNCVYDVVFNRAGMRRADELPTADLLRRLDDRWKLLVVGDAAMHPAELLEPYGAIDPRRTSPTPGFDWLRRLSEHFARSAWLNPDKPEVWEHSHTVRLIRRLFPMHHLSVEGVTEAIGALVGARVAAGGSVH